MRILLAASTALFLTACSGSNGASADVGAMVASATAATTQVAAKGDPAHPTVIELYQSQGCSSCPPAIGVVNKYADRDDVIPLTFAVTYWDNLGWKDTFGSPAYTARQWDYAHTAGRAQVATPQVIVNGRDAVLGSREGELNQAIARNANKAGPEIAVAGDQVTVGAGTGDATVWAVRYDPRTIDVAIQAGENGGRTIPHRNIVRQLTNIGQWHGSATSFTLPASPAGLRTAVLVQQGKGGPIVAAAKI